MKAAVLAIFALGALVLAPFASATLLFTTTLVGGNEVPPAPSPGIGFAQLILHDDLNTLDVFETFSGLTSPAVAAHIHCCSAPGANAPVRLPFSAAQGFPFGLASGTFTHTFNLSADLIGITPAAFILGLQSTQTYANIHTGPFSGGEIRGQLALAVPEPATLALLFGALAGLGFSRRTKVARISR